MTYHSSLSDPLTFVRFFTHVMGHSGWEHFISNASYLLLLGPMLEEKHGSSRILGVILITALGRQQRGVCLHPADQLYRVPGRGDTGVIPPGGGHLPGAAGL